MRDWKNSFRLLKYGYDFTSDMIVVISFFVMGMILFAVGRNAVIVGSLFTATACLNFSQSPVKMETSGLIASSPKRRMFGIHLPNVMASMGILLAYLIIQILLNAKVVSGKLLFTIYLILLVLQLYIGVVSRLIRIGFVICWCLPMGCIMFELHDEVQMIPDMDIAVANRVGFLLVMAGAVLGVLLRRLVYRLPISKSDINVIYRKQRQLNE